MEFLTMIKIKNVNAPVEIKKVNISTKQTRKENTKQLVEDINELSEPVEASVDLDLIDTLEDSELMSLKSYNLTMYQTIRKFTKSSPNKPRVVNSHQLGELEFNKCKYDIVYYLENYCLIPAAGANIRLLLNNKLRIVARLFEASVPHLFMTSRQSSKTTIELACFAWYFNFWNNTGGILINLTQPDNKKNIKFIKDMISFLPNYLRVWNPKVNRDDIDNTMEIATPETSNSKISGVVIDKSDPGSTGRGKTGALYWDEIGYLKGIKAAYAAVSFVYNTYSKFASKAGVPAPLAITTTPNDINDPSGAFFAEMWQSSTEIDDYDQIKDMLPYELYDWFIESNAPYFKVFQRWYEFPNRIDHPELVNKNNPDNIIQLLEDINTSPEAIAQYDKAAARWLIDTIKICNGDKRTIKKDIYCLFFSSSESAIFDEETADVLLECKVQPKKYITLDVKGLHQKPIFKFYKNPEKYSYTDSKTVITVDPAKSAMGDNLSINLVDFDTSEVVGDLQVKTGKIRGISDVIAEINKMFPNSPIIIERNSFGEAVIERIEEIYPKVFKKVFYYHPVDRKGNVNRSIKEYGIYTGKDNREQMFNLLIDFVNNNPKKLNSPVLIDELITLEYKNNKIQASVGSNDDCVMSYNLFLYCKEFKYQYLNRFFFDQKKILANSRMLGFANEMKGVDIQTVDIILKRIETDAIADDIEESKRMLGEFSEELNNPYTSPIDFFSKLNS